MPFEPFDQYFQRQKKLAELRALGADPYSHRFEWTHTIADGTCTTATYKLSPTDWGAAKWSWENGRPAGWSSETLPGAGWLFLPLKTTRGTIGLLGISYERRGTVVSAEQRRLLDAIADQVAVSIERVRLAADFEEARVFTEAEKLRAALLASISHDLRTPLVSIIGSATISV